MAQRRKLSRIKELDELTDPTPRAQSGEPAVELAQSSPESSAADSEPAEPSDNTPPPSDAAPGNEPAKQEPGTFGTEAEDRPLTLALPAPVLLQLEERARRDNSSLRVVILEALAAAGYQVGPQQPIRRPWQQLMRRPYRPVSAYSDLARAIMLLSLLSR
jgi:hypothetical protein